MRYFVLIFSIAIFGSCNWAKDKAKQTIHKGGEIVGKAGSEMADGVKDGVEETFKNLVEVSPALSGKGIEVGKIIISGTDSSSDNIVSVYIIFHSKFDGKIMAKAVNKDKTEFGRSTLTITAEANDAKYFDFVFDKRTNLDRSDKVVLEGL